MASDDDDLRPGEPDEVDRAKLDRFWEECKMQSLSLDEQNAAVLRDRYFALTPQQRSTFRQAIKALLLAQERIGRLGPGFFYTSLHMRLGSFASAKRHELLVYEPMLQSIDVWDTEQVELN
jgi:hypothetical protein